MLNEFIKKSVRQIVGGNGPPVAFLVPKGDPGLFGPESVAWKVHADFVSMMIGGISSLVLQAMHPQALAGVWDHSTFRTDLTGRLGRTAFFIAATTYGSHEMAHRSIQKVNAIHQHIHGLDELGHPYRATDPHLLRWVHLTETLSFMNAYQRHCKPTLTLAQQDQYFKEMKMLGEMMGAENLPDTLAGTEHAIKAYVPELFYGHRAETIVNLLKDFPTTALAKPLVTLFSKAGFLNLPDWAFEILKKSKPSSLERYLISSTVELVSMPVREALKDGVAAHARRRMEMSP